MRYYRKKNRTSFFPQMMNLIMNGNQSKRIFVFSIFCQQFSAVYLLYWCVLHSKSNKVPHLGNVKRFCPWKQSAIRSGCINIIWQKLNNFSFKEFAERIISISIVRHRNIMLAFIFENNFDACKYPTRSFPSSSLLFFFPWSYPLYLQPYLSINTPPRYLYLPSLPHSYIIVIIDKLVVELVERGRGGY